jgi:hypothetical protein
MTSDKMLGSVRDNVSNHGAIESPFDTWRTACTCLILDRTFRGECDAIAQPFMLRSPHTGLAGHQGDVAMPYVRSLRQLFAVAALLMAGPLWAGNPILPVIVNASDDAYAFQSPGVGAPVTQTITLNFNANGTQGQAARISPIGISGSGYNIIGGSCVPGMTNTLDATIEPSCTVVVQYTPSAQAGNDGQLTISCQTIAATGGFTVTCTPGVGTGSISLLGSVLAAFVTRPAPMLDPKLLTMLAVLLLGVGTFAAARRNG